MENFKEISVECNSKEEIENTILILHSYEKHTLINGTLHSTAKYKNGFVGIYKKENRIYIDQEYNQNLNQIIIPYTDFIKQY